MTNLNNKPGVNSRLGFSTIMKAWLVAGTLDICSAFIYSYIKSGAAPQKILQYIANVVLGKKNGMEEWQLTITGLFIHYLIALGWTLPFFILYTRMKWMGRNFMLTAIVYGVFVWAMMNIVILPAWNSKPFVFRPVPSTTNAVILILAIGMPLSFFAKKYSKA